MAADQFVAKQKGALAHNLYVAMTRARSILYVYGQRRDEPEEMRIMSILQECHEDLVDRPTVEREVSAIDEFEDLAQILGPEHHKWLESLFKKNAIKQEPILASEGQILAEPIFWLQNDETIYACFGHLQPSQGVLHRLEDAGVRVLKPGGEISPKG